MVYIVWSKNPATKWKLLERTRLDDVLEISQENICLRKRSVAGVCDASFQMRKQEDCQYWKICVWCVESNHKDQTKNKQNNEAIILFSDNTSYAPSVFRILIFLCLGINVSNVQSHTRATDTVFAILHIHWLLLDFSLTVKAANFNIHIWTRFGYFIW